MAEEMTEEMTEYDRRRENRLDKYLDYLNPEIRRKLNPKDTTYFELMQKAFHWRSKFFSPEQVRKMIMTEAKYSYSMACQVHSDMEYLFGKQEEANENTLRKILLEFYHTSIQLAMKADGKELEKAQLIASNADKIAKLYRLFDNVSSFTPEQLMPAMTFVIGGTLNQQNNIIKVPPKYDPTNETN